MDKVLHMIDSITGINLDFKLDNGFEMSFQDIIGVVGFSAPGILLVISIFLLKKKTKYLKYFVSGYVLNSILNLLLRRYRLYFDDILILAAVLPLGVNLFIVAVTFLDHEPYNNYLN